MGSEQRRDPVPWVQQLRGRTKGPVPVQLSPEIGVDFPVEVFTDHGPGFVGAGTLGLSPELEAALTAWLHWWQDHVDLSGAEVIDGSEDEWRQWDLDGNELLERVRHELSPGFSVRRV